MGSRRLFLAEDPKAPGHGADAGLRRALIDRPGEQIKRVHNSRRSLALDEVRHTARTLQFLTEQGWRPRQVTLTLLWWRLAQRLEEQAMAEAGRGTLRPAEAEELSEEAREMLAAALRHAEVLPRVEAIRDQRAALAEDLIQGRLLQQRRILATDKKGATKDDAE